MGVLIVLVYLYLFLNMDSRSLCHLLITLEQPQRQKSPPLPTLLSTPQFPESGAFSSLMRWVLCLPRDGNRPGESRCVSLTQKRRGRLGRKTLLRIQSAFSLNSQWLMRQTLR